MSSLPMLQERRAGGPLSRPRRVIGAALALVLTAALGAAGHRAPQSAPDAGIARLDSVPPPPGGRSWAPAPVRVDGLAALATSNADGFALHTAGGPVTFLPGVNLGSTKPGHQPGELPGTADDYRRWFAAMAWLGVRVVRVYTIHPPAFYSELLRHNRASPERPLYLVQGVYLPDESYVQTRDLYQGAGTEAFTRELRDAVEAVHGNLHRDVTPGRAAGDWTADVSPWLAAWIAGVEWDPYAVDSTDRRNPNAPAHDGKYFRSTPEASPTERWIAARLDELATAQAAHGLSVPIAHANWPTTDPLRHPEEPLEQEDLVGVDANHILPTPAWPGGTFASYHAYPYYPDFQRHEPALQAFRYRGRGDPYAGYLDALKRHHAGAGMPTMITEFGVPSSIGSAHVGPLGRDQGGHSEREAMAMDAELMDLIQDLGLAGALVFAWTDEWFKFTWNTINHQEPAERRSLWHDPLTNEQHFGLIAMDATGAVNDAVTRLGPVTARVDESYVHLRVRAPGAKRLTIGFDTLPGEAAGAPPGATSRSPETAFALDLAARTGEAWIRSDLDPMPLDYAGGFGTRPPALNGWTRYQLTTNRDLVIPTTGQRLPAEFLDVGTLRYGGWDPLANDFDNRALWRIEGDDVVLRVPWGLAGFADPSSKAVLVPRGRQATAQVVDGVDLNVSIDGNDTAVGHLTWESWQRVGYAERLKDGARAVRDAFVRTAANGEH
ncbi:hypothetical protein Val02_58270 [Virgisporangium aliadipatigenens]|uniref:Uncharacterized protein n=1 Tax=Virgisporangium aliadipatigenens TaxID=741659 RepID=A0A8J4DT77_9ACTN|nr:hypothetical protein [Virgisporangium aliadipatigenens]GIJ48941.1 hypothetical protein Val02_58270 [Virgisporangium aliadipatigenens]